MRLHYQRTGQGRPLILLHGLVGSSRNWFGNMAYLGQEATVYAIDLINMGESERVPQLDAGMEATADRVVRCMDALGLDQADIAGHSHGGAIAMMLAAHHPNRVRSLILCAPANPFCDLGLQLIRFYKSGFGRNFARLVPLLPKRLKAIALSRMYGDPSRVPPGALEGYTAGLRLPGTIDHVLEILRLWSRDMARLRTVLSQVALKPTLLLWGDRDRAVSLTSGRELLRHLPQSRLVVLPGAGHIPFEEMPELCNAVMRDWLNAACDTPPDAYLSKRLSLATGSRVQQKSLA